MAPTEQTPILIVDDREENLTSLTAVIRTPDIHIITAQSGNEALSAILKHEFALVILDVQMPGMDGFETAELIRNQKRFRDMPIIFVTALGRESSYVFKGYETGAVDFLTKPLDPYIINSKIDVFVKLYRARKRLEATGEALRETITELELANEKIISQQEEVVKKERLNALLQLAGATAHELNQPLMILLGNIELLGLEEEPPKKVSDHLNRIKEAGYRISEIVKKIQQISNDKVKAHDKHATIIDIDQ